MKAKLALRYRIRVKLCKVEDFSGGKNGPTFFSVKIRKIGILVTSDGKYQVNYQRRQ